jgi:hypothetical protein
MVLHHFGQVVIPRDAARADLSDLDRITRRGLPEYGRRNDRRSENEASRPGSRSFYRFSPRQSVTGLAVLCARPVRDFPGGVGHQFFGLGMGWGAVLNGIIGRR